MRKHSPDVFQYNDHRNFLKDALLGSEEIEPSMSLRAFADRAGFGSAAILSLIIKGKRRLTKTSAKKIVDTLKITGRRKNFFLSFADLDSAKTEKERMQIKEKMLRLKSVVDENQIEWAQYQILSKWYYPAIYAMIGGDNFSSDPTLISKSFRNQVSAREAEEALGDLEKLGLIRCVEGKWVQTQGALKTGEDLRSQAIFQYHLQMMRLAQEALELPARERDYSGLTISISESHLSTVKEKIRNFRKELNEYLSQFNSGERVYQINIQLFPLTFKKQKEN